MCCAKTGIVCLCALSVYPTRCINSFTCMCVYILRQSLSQMHLLDSCNTIAFMHSCTCATNNNQQHVHAVAWSRQSQQGGLLGDHTLWPVTYVCHHSSHTNCAPSSWGSALQRLWCAAGKQKCWPGLILCCLIAPGATLSLYIYIQKNYAHQLLMGVTHTAVGYSSSENVGERKRCPNHARSSDHPLCTLLDVCRCIWIFSILL